MTGDHGYLSFMKTNAFICPAAAISDVALVPRDYLGLFGESRAASGTADKSLRSRFGDNLNGDINRFVVRTVVMIVDCTWLW